MLLMTMFMFGVSYGVVASLLGLIASPKSVIDSDGVTSMSSGSWVCCGY